MMAQATLTCPGCQSEVGEPHCRGSHDCRWRVCMRCQLVLTTGVDGEIRSMVHKQVH